MVDFLCDLAGDDAVVVWASRVVHPATAGAESTAKANAALILQRRGIIVQAVNYAGADLRGKDLSTHDFTGADLTAADLSGAVLPRRLGGATLHRAQLVAARCDGADLTGADLREADLSQARLIGADLRAARLAGAVLDRAVLVGAELDPWGLTGAAGTFGTALPGSPAQVQLGSSSPISALAAIHGGDILATGHADGTVRVWDPATGARCAPWKATPTGSKRWRWTRRAAGWPPPAPMAWCGCGIRPPVPAAHPGRPHRQGLSVGGGPGGPLAGLRRHDGMVRLWDPATGARCAPWKATPAGSRRWRWTRRAAGWPPPATMGWCGCGTPPPGPRCAPWKATPTGSGRWPSTRRAAGWPPPATMGWCGCGTPPPGPRCAPWKATPAGSGRWPPTRRAAGWPRPARWHGAGVGSGHRCAAAHPGRPHRTGPSVGGGPGGPLAGLGRRRWHGAGVGSGHRCPLRTLEGHTGWV